MATNGMTINGLNPLSALTADDKIPVWDTGASGEPTKEITAQNMANSLKSLASLPNTTEMNAAIAQSTARSVYASSDVFNAQSGGTIKANYSFSTKMANVCYLQLNVTAASSGSLVTVAELKSGFIPYSKNIYTLAIDENDNSTREVNINANNGQIGIYGAVSGHTYNISVTYIVSPNVEQPGQGRM